jgi:hypothetical protein
MRVMSLIGKRVSVNKIKNGYFVGSFKGTVIDEKSGKVKVQHYQGNYWRSINNVKEI